MNVWVMQNENIIDAQKSWIWFWYYHTSSQLNMKDKQNFASFISGGQNTKYLGVWGAKKVGGGQNTIFWPSGRAGISFGSIKKAL